MPSALFHFSAFAFCLGLWFWCAGCAGSQGGRSRVARRPGVSGCFPRAQGAPPPASMHVHDAWLPICMCMSSSALSASRICYYAPKASSHISVQQVHAFWCSLIKVCLTGLTFLFFRFPRFVYCVVCLYEECLTTNRETAIDVALFYVL